MPKCYPFIQMKAAYKLLMKRYIFWATVLLTAACNNAGPGAKGTDSTEAVPLDSAGMQAMAKDDSASSRPASVPIPDETGAPATWALLPFVKQDGANPVLTPGTGEVRGIRSGICRWRGKRKMYLTLR